MSIKSKAMAITAAAALALTATNCDSPLGKNKKQEIAEVLADSISNNSDGLQTQSQKNDSIDLAKENSDACFTVHMKDLEGGPLFGSKRMITPSYGNLLGFSQAEEIMKKHNGKKGESFNVNEVLNANDTLTVPFIYPELKSYFPQNWSELVSLFPKYKDISENNLIFIARCDDGKSALAYYKDGKLTLATHVSLGNPKIWKAVRTPSGIFTLKKDSIRRRSTEYGRSPMPYSIHVEGAGRGGVFLHQGWVNGLNQSHGCGRVPGLYQKFLYENLPEYSKGVLHDLYNPTLTKH